MARWFLRVERLREVESHSLTSQLQTDVDTLRGKLRYTSHIIKKSSQNGKLQPLQIYKVSSSMGVFSALTDCERQQTPDAKFCSAGMLCVVCSSSRLCMYEGGGAQRRNVYRQAWLQPTHQPQQECLRTASLSLLHQAVKSPPAQKIVNSSTLRNNTLNNAIQTDLLQRKGGYISPSAS